MSQVLVLHKLASIRRSTLRMRFYSLLGYGVGIAALFQYAIACMSFNASYVPETPHSREASFYKLQSPNRASLKSSLLPPSLRTTHFIVCMRDLCIIIELTVVVSDGVNGERNSLMVTIENKSDRNVTLEGFAGSLSHAETGKVLKNVCGT